MLALSSSFPSPHYGPSLFLARARVPFCSQLLVAGHFHYFLFRSSCVQRGRGFERGRLIPTTVPLLSRAEFPAGASGPSLRE